MSPDQPSAALPESAQDDAEAFPTPAEVQRELKAEEKEALAFAELDGFGAGRKSLRAEIAALTERVAVEHAARLHAEKVAAEDGAKYLKATAEIAALDAEVAAANELGGKVVAERDRLAAEIAANREVMLEALEVLAFNASLCMCETWHKTGATTPCRNCRLKPLVAKLESSLGDSK